jgi:excisionase family DNA binding protein
MKNSNTNHNGNSGSHATPSPVFREDEFEPLLDSEEAAALLKIHPKTLQKLARNGEIAAIQIGKLWRFRASALNRWLERIAS